MKWARTTAIAILLSGAALRGHAENVSEINPTRSNHPWTVVTVAPDGSWGIGHKPYMYQAIAEAVTNCKKMHRKNIGCGAQLQTIQAGWVVVIRCHNTNILTPASVLSAAVQLASKREATLRAKSAQEFSACAHIVTVNPNGTALPYLSVHTWTEPVSSQQAGTN